MGFGVEEAVQVANQVVGANVGRSLSDVEVIILKGAWERLDYDQIAAQNQYSTSYVSNDIAPKLWRTLSDALGEKVRKSNFRGALERYWENSPTSIQTAEGIALKTQGSNLPPLTASKQTQLSNAPTDPQPNQHPKSKIQNLKSDDFFVPDEHYIPRPPIEQKSYDTILQPGSLLRIKAPKQMGKTSLVNHLLCQFNPKDYRTVHLSLELSDRRKHLVDLSQFLRWFCLNISRELGLPGELDEYWDEEGLGAKVSCTTYFEQYLLPDVDSPLVLCLDDVDLLFPFPEVYEDFFGLLRSWYEKARSRRIWKKFRLVIIHATDVYIRLNIHQSPFNVGVPVSLPDFTLEQAQSLASACQLDGTVEQVAPLLDWVGGHPYLLTLAFSELANRGTDRLNELLAELPTNAGIYGGHLREHLLNLEQEEELAIALKKVIHADGGVTLKPMVAYKLQSMGLIALVGNEAQSRCRLYTHYFTEQFADDA
ncbi:MAG: AAA-like domain-containing protein [Cyanobacteria bacterium P01_F01_bin.150]